MTKVGIRMALKMGRIGRGKRLFREEGGIKDRDWSGKGGDFPGHPFSGRERALQFLSFLLCRRYCYLCGWFTFHLYCDRSRMIPAL